MSQEPKQTEAEGTPMGDEPASSPALRRARAALEATADTKVDAATMFSEVQREVTREHDAPFTGLRERSTAWRRGVALSALVIIVAVELWRHGSSALSISPLRVAVSLALLGVLMFAVLWTSLRPLHLPGLSRRAELGWIGGSLLCALALSLWPGGAAGTSLWDSLRGAWPCLAYGSMVALPVYWIVRVLDRGAWITGMLAAVAAGLGANFVLMTHCPSAGPDHMLLGHFAVIALFVAGYGLWSRLRRDRAR